MSVATSCIIVATFVLVVALVNTTSLDIIFGFILCYIIFKIYALGPGAQNQHALQHQTAHVHGEHHPKHCPLCCINVNPNVWSAIGKKISFNSTFKSYILLFI